MKKEKIELDSQITFENFTELLKKEEYFTKLYSLKVKQSALDMLEEHLNKDQWRRSNCSSFTETTSIASTTLDSNTGTTSCYIQKRKNDTLYSLNVESPSGNETVKLEVYPSNKICELPKQEWWRHASTKAIFTIPSCVDPLKMTLDQLLVQAGKLIKSQPGNKVERKKIGSSSGYGNTRQAPY
ncbi:unnamed protein product [Brassicogethes aeneus]|uniref:Uncharacterized protein n=1 Tax=Brassicogethes aeneus TaxID=1431903 RepID=A0A9P0BER4_BRAAE|nr:unnamed protein product [Brassicogethes aeneus]